MSDNPAAADESVDTADSEPSEPSDGEPTVETLVARIAAHDEALAETAQKLGDRIEQLEADLEAKNAEIDELTEKLSRSRADFQNYKKRTKKKQDEMKARAAEDVVTQFTTVRENLVRALDQDEDADIRPGVESTLESFDDVLEAENVSFIAPQPGDAVDPERHEVMLQVESDQPEGTIADVYQHGYEMAGKVLQAAQVTVSSNDA
jgi:molecular chaperone GrpE